MKNTIIAINLLFKQLKIQMRIKLNHIHNTEERRAFVRHFRKAKPMLLAAETMLVNCIINAQMEQAAKEMQCGGFVPNFNPERCGSVVDDSEFIINR